MMMRKTFIVVLAACLGILWVAGPAHAQRRGGGSRGGWGGGWDRGGISIGVGSYNPAWSGGYYSSGYPLYGGSNYYGSPYRYGNAYPYSYNYNSPYYSGYSGYSGSYYPSYSENYSYPSTTGYYSYPGQIVTSTSGTVMPAEGFATTNQPSTYQSFYSGPSTSADRAQLRVMLPSAEAKLWIDDTPAQQTGTERLFTTPSLSSGVYSYMVKATWSENGREVSRQKKVEFQPGQTVFVDMRATDTEQLLNQPSIRPTNQPSTGTFNQVQPSQTNQNPTNSNSNAQGQPDRQLERQRNQNPDRP